MIKKDTMFKSVKEEYDFKFDKSVADVFEDMLNRSIPLYSCIQDLIVSFCNKYSTDNDLIIDLGCSHGFTCINIASKLNRKIIGVDNSSPMIEKAYSNLAKRKNGIENIEFKQLNISPNNISKFNNASVFILSLTLQFIRPIERPKILKSIFENLRKGGIVILIEKTVLPEHSLNNIFIDLYHDFKKSNGYTDTEIAKKRIAIENVLVPYSIEENRKMLIDTGFAEATTFVQWLNFSGVIAIK